MQRVIDYYYTHVSPWAYLGHESFLKLANDAGYGIRFKPVNLGPVFAETGGLPLQKRHVVRRNYRLVEMQRWREKRGLQLLLQPKFFPCDPSLADRIAVALAVEGGPAAEYSLAVFRALWAEDFNIADPAVLRAVLEKLGLEADRVMLAAEDKDIQEKYASHQTDAIAADVFGSPSYVVNGEVFWGQDRLEALADMLQSGRDPYVS